MHLAGRLTGIRVRGPGSEQALGVRGRRPAPPRGVASAARGSRGVPHADADPGAVRRCRGRLAARARPVDGCRPAGRGAGPHPGVRGRHRRVLEGPPRPAREGRRPGETPEGRSQRPVPLRLRPQVQALLRRSLTGSTVFAGCLRRTPMDVESAIRAFASAGHDLPRYVMRWALDHWDEAAPGLLGVLERFADGTDRSEGAADALFFILHLAGERREARAFAPLCRLAKEAGVLETVMGDGVTTTLKRILIGTYDGDLDTLKGVIE